MLRAKFEYRGVNVEVFDFGSLQARMRVQGDRFLMPTYPQATKREGFGVLNHRVMEAINAHLNELTR